MLSGDTQISSAKSKNSNRQFYLGYANYTKEMLAFHCINFRFFQSETENSSTNMSKKKP